MVDARVAPETSKKRPLPTVFEFLSFPPSCPKLHDSVIPTFQEVQYQQKPKATCCPSTPLPATGSLFDEVLKTLEIFYFAKKNLQD